METEHLRILRIFVALQQTGTGTGCLVTGLSVTYKAALLNFLIGSWWIYVDLCMDQKYSLCNKSVVTFFSNKRTFESTRAEL